MSRIPISIIVTCYNQRDFIREAVDSALRQGAHEVIVVDDASDDGSFELLQEYGDAIKLCRMARNGGAPRARNHGASLATGTYFVFLDGDDILMPMALCVYQRLLERRRATVIIGQTVSFAGQVQPIDRRAASGPVRFVEFTVPMAKDRAAGLIASAMVIEREALLRVGGWTPEIFYGDIKDLMMKLGYAGPLVLILEPATALYRIHDKNSIHDVSNYIKNAYQLIASEREGRYAGGIRHAFQRYGVLGAYIGYWSIKGLARGLWKDALKLIGSGLPMILAGVVQRCAARIRGLRPFDTIDVDSRPPSVSRPSTQRLA